MGLNGSAGAVHALNLYEVTNLVNLATEFRLFAVRGLPEDENFDRNVQHLVSRLQSELRQPVARISRAGEAMIALPVAAPNPPARLQLVPHVASLEPVAGSEQLRFDQLTQAMTPIARAYLRFALSGPLYADRSIWQSGRSWYDRTPQNLQERSATIDMYAGFKFSVVLTGDGRAFVAVDLASAYVDRLWLSQRLNGGDFRSYRGRRVLYHFGPTRYFVQLQALAPKSISEQTFFDRLARREIDVLSYTREKHPRDALVTALDPNGAAILYRRSNGGEDRYGALALCKLAYTTRHREVAALHRRAIVDPAERFARLATIVQRRFQVAQLGGQRIVVSPEPLRAPQRIFAMPPQRFGGARVLGTEPSEGVTDVAPITTFGRSRLDLLLDPGAGPIDRSPFDTQYLVVPQSLERAIAEDFQRRFEAMMRQVSRQPAYVLRRALYDDRATRGLFRQMKALEFGLTSAHALAGYGLLILPVTAHPDLHDHAKRRHWPRLQFQCVDAARLQRYYERSGTTWRVRPGDDRRFNSYVRNIALGLLIANRKWPWALARPLHFDVHVGVDLLNGHAGVTTVYAQAAQIYFRDRRCAHREQLPRAQLRQMLVEALAEDLANVHGRARALLIHRDGRAFASERAAVRDAVDQLIARGTLPADVTVGIIEVHKSSADPLRIVADRGNGSFENPQVGSWFALSSRSGVVATTGAPFLGGGTADPLAVEIVQGEMSLEEVLEDVYALSTLIFSAPNSCGRLPATLRIGDDLLAPIAAADPGSAELLYDHEEPGESARDEHTAIEEPA